MIDPFEIDKNEDINIEHIYDVIYGSLLNYYNDVFLNYRLIKKNDSVMLLKIIDIEQYEFVCSFSIDFDNNRILIIYNENDEQKVQSFKLEYDIESNKYKIYKNFIFIFNESHKKL